MALAPLSMVGLCTDNRKFRQPDWTLDHTGRLVWLTRLTDAAADQTFGIQVDQGPAKGPRTRRMDS